MRSCVYKHVSFFEKNPDELFHQIRNWMKKISEEPEFKIIYSSLFMGDFLWLSTIYRIPKNTTKEVTLNEIPVANRTEKPIKTKGLTKMSLKNWFPFFKGEKIGTSAQIRHEIEEIEQQIQEIRSRATAVSNDLKAAGIERLAGGDPGEKIITLESEIRRLERDIELLNEVKQGLSEKLADAVQRETSERISEIDQEIEEIQKKAGETKEQALAQMAELAATLWLVNGTGVYEVLQLLYTNSDESRMVRERSEGMISGQPTYNALIQQLRNERKQLVTAKGA